MKAIYYRMQNGKVTCWEFKTLTEARKQVSGDWTIVDHDETVTVLQTSTNDDPEPTEIEAMTGGPVAINIDPACEDAGVFLEIRDN